MVGGFEIARSSWGSFGFAAMKVLVFGQTGQVASELQKTGTDHHVVALGRNDANLEQSEECGTAIHNHRPDAVINAAAFTGVDDAETDQSRAHQINAVAPAVMARACKELGIPFLHISSDYVFDGSGNTPWSVDAQPSPLGVYGRAKAQGEQAIKEHTDHYAIMRTSWVFSAHGTNFVRSMMRLSQTHDHLNIVDDQVGGPTSARDIARALMVMAQALVQHPQKSGTYHYAGAPAVSWAEFAKTIVDMLERATTVRPIPSSDYPTKAQRPLNSRLDCQSTQDVFGLEQPSWRAALRDVLAELDYGNVS